MLEPTPRRFVNRRISAFQKRIDERIAVEGN
jgi:hypothetical protein